MVLKIDVKLRIEIEKKNEETHMIILYTIVNWLLDKI
jgi:hypothetical protein